MRFGRDAHSYWAMEVWRLQSPVEVYYQEMPWSSDGFQRLRGPHASMLFRPHGIDGAQDWQVQRVDGGPVLPLREVVTEQSITEMWCIMRVSAPWAWAMAASWRVGFAAARLSEQSLGARSAQLP